MSTGHSANVAMRLVFGDRIIPLVQASRDRVKPQQPVSVFGDCDLEIVVDGARTTRQVTVTGSDGDWLLIADKLRVGPVRDAGFGDFVPVIAERDGKTYGCDVYLSSEEISDWQDGNGLIANGIATEAEALEAAKSAIQ